MAQGGDDAFRRTSGSHHDIDIRPGISDHQGSSHISIGMELNARAGGADISDEFRVTRLVQNKNHKVVNILPQCLCNMPEVVLYRSVDIDDIARLAPHDDFLQ